MPKTFMVKKHRRPQATSTPTITISASGETMTSSRRIWSPWCDDSPPDSSISGHVTQHTGRTLVDVGQLTGVMSSDGCVTSFPATDRQYGALWSPYSLEAELGELLPCLLCAR